MKIPYAPPSSDPPGPPPFAAVERKITVVIDVRCPYCGGDNLQAWGDFTAHGEGIERTCEVQCTDCGRDCRVYLTDWTRRRNAPLSRRTRTTP